MKKYLVFAIPTAAAMPALALWLSLPVGPVTALMAEGGAIETLTLFAYGAAIVAMCLTLLVDADRIARAAILVLLRPDGRPQRRRAGQERGRDARAQPAADGGVRGSALPAA